MVTTDKQRYSFILLVKKMREIFTMTKRDRAYFDKTYKQHHKTIRTGLQA